MVFQSLAGKLALVTGGASGIGKATCQQLASLGATVIVTDLQFEKCQIVKNELTNQNLAHSAIAVDVACSKSVQKMVSELQAKYKIPPCIVIHSAGIAFNELLSTTECSEEVWDKLVDVNLKGTFLINKAFAKLMKDAMIPGSIVNISSVAREGYPKGIPYAASKAGVVGVTATMAKEFGRYNIRCNAIAPGMIETPMMQYNPPRIMEGYIKSCSMKRFGKPEEVAALCVFLASDQSSYINGEVININGGKL